MFQIEGQPANEMITEGQLRIFWALVFRPALRIQIESCTQYGKSQTVGIACVIIACVQDEVVSVVAPSDEKAKEIMRYFIQHLGDHPVFSSQLESNTRLERLRQEESKDRIILREGGGIYTLSVNQRNFGKSIESAMGKGSRIVIVDEAGLVADPTEATIYRMIAGKGKFAFYCKIGNTFYTEPPYSHFYKTSDTYAKIWIDYKQALAEGRYTEEFIKEARGKPLFRELYECKYPPKDKMDADGFRFLFPKELVLNAFVDALPDELTGTKVASIDVGRGGDPSAYVERQDKYLWLKSTDQVRDLMVTAQQVEQMLEDGANWANIDDTGVGGGVTDRCLERGLNVQGINWASAPQFDKMRFRNRKAENYWSLYEFLLEGGKLLKNEGWLELLEIKYKIDSSEKILIEPKERMLRRGVRSPNIADAGALSFNTMSIPDISFI